MASSPCLQILFLAQHCSFFLSCMSFPSPAWTEPLPFCLSQTKLALQKQLSKALPAGFLTSPLNPAALCTMASGPMALRLPPGPTAIIQGPLINPTLFRPAPGPLRTTHAPIIFSPYWPWARNRFGVKEWSSSNWARCRWTLSWSDGRKTADLLRDSEALCSGRCKRRSVVQVVAVPSCEIAQILLKNDISAQSDSWKP